MNLTKNQVKMFMEDEGFKKAHPHQWRYMWTQNKKYEMGNLSDSDVTIIGFCGETGMAHITMARMLGGEKPLEGIKGVLPEDFYEI